MLRRSVWLAVGVLLLALTVVGYLVFPLLSLIAGVLLIVALGGLVGWLRLKRRANSLTVFVSRFHGKTWVAQQTALDHLDSLVSRLREDDLLMRYANVVPIKTPLNPSQAERLLAETGGLAVVYGDLRVQSEEGRWEGWVLTGWPTDRSPATYDAYGYVGDRPDHSRYSTETLPIDASLDVRVLTARVFRADHADAVHGIVLALTAQDIAFERSDDGGTTAGELLDNALRYRSSLTAHALAQIAITRDYMRWGDPPADRIRTLRQEAGSGADHPDLWECMDMICHIAEHFFHVPMSKTRVECAERLAAFDATNPRYLHTLALAYVAAKRSKDVRRTLQRMETLPLDEHYRTALAELRGDLDLTAHEYARALDQFSQAIRSTKRSTARVLSNLALAQEKTGRVSEARRSYKRALRLVARSDVPLTPDQGSLYVFALFGADDEDSTTIGMAPWGYRPTLLLGRFRPSRRLALRLARFVWWTQPDRIGSLYLVGYMYAANRQYRAAGSIFFIPALPRIDPSAMGHVAMLAGLDGRYEGMRGYLDALAETEIDSEGTALTREQQDDLRVLAVFQIFRVNEELFEEPTVQPSIDLVKEKFPEAWERFSSEGDEFYAFKSRND